MSTHGQVQQSVGATRQSHVVCKQARQRTASTLFSLLFRQHTCAGDSIRHDWRAARKCCVTNWACLAALRAALVLKCTLATRLACRLSRKVLKTARITRDTGRGVDTSIFSSFTLHAARHRGFSVLSRRAKLAGKAAGVACFAWSTRYAAWTSLHDKIRVPGALVATRLSTLLLVEALLC